MVENVVCTSGDHRAATVNDAGEEENKRGAPAF